MLLCSYSDFIILATGCGPSLSFDCSTGAFLPEEESPGFQRKKKAFFSNLMEYEILVSEEQSQGGREGGLAQSQTSDSILQLQRNNWSSLDSQSFTFQFPKRLLQTWQHTLQ